MFSIYDYTMEENIVCFKPDPLRGKIKKSEKEVDSVDES
jgi:hypothetical protein